MSRVFKAYCYYLGCAGRNRVRTLKKKLKSPRYIIGLLLAAVYIWFFFFRNISLAADSGSADSQYLGRYALTFFYGLSIFMAWILGPFGRGLVFREHEIQQLFAAPLLRRHLLLFKFMQAQGPLIITALVFAAIGNRFSSKPYLMLVFGLYLAGNLTHVHSIFAILTTKRLRENDGLVAWLAFAPGIALVAALVYGVWAGIQEVDLIRSGADFVQVMETPFLSAVIRPLTFLADFIVYDHGMNLLLSTVVILITTGLLMTLVVVLDHRFEDHAVKVAAVIANLKTEGLAALSKKNKLVVKDKKGSFPRLAPTGKVWRAIVWKNIVSIGRLQRKAFRIILLLLIMAFFIASTVADEAQDAKVNAIIGFVALGIASYMSLLGPALLRVDLRIDIPHFDVLKSMPIRGRDLLFGEIMGPALVISAAQWTLAILGALILPSEAGSTDITIGIRAAIILSAIPGFFAVAFALFTLENLFALYLPSFARLGRGMKSGFDQFGQNLMGAIIRALVVVVALIPAAIVGAIVVGVSHFLLKAPVVVTVPVAVWICSLAVYFECSLLIKMSEERYEVFDLSSESLTVDS